MFNVKGADLLFLDKPVEVSAQDDPELAERYERAGQRVCRAKTGRCTNLWESRSSLSRT